MKVEGLVNVVPFGCSIYSSYSSSCTLLYFTWWFGVRAWNSQKCMKGEELVNIGQLGVQFTLRF